MWNTCMQSMYSILVPRPPCPVYSHLQYRKFKDKTWVVVHNTPVHIRLCIVYTDCVKRSTNGQCALQMQAHLYASHSVFLEKNGTGYFLWLMFKYPLINSNHCFHQLHVNHSVNLLQAWVFPQHGKTPSCTLFHSCTLLVLSLAGERMQYRLT